MTIYNGKILNEGNTAARLKEQENLEPDLPAQNLVISAIESGARATQTARGSLGY